MLSQARRQLRPARGSLAVNVLEVPNLSVNLPEC